MISENLNISRLNAIFFKVSGLCYEQRLIKQFIFGISLAQNFFIVKWHYVKLRNALTATLKMRLFLDRIFNYLQLLLFCN